MYSGFLEDRLGAKTLARAAASMGSPTAVPNRGQDFIIKDDADGKGAITCSMCFDIIGI